MRPEPEETQWEEGRSQQLWFLFYKTDQNPPYPLLLSYYSAGSRVALAEHFLVSALPWSPRASHLSCHTLNKVPARKC